MSLSDTINKSCQDPKKPPQRPQQLTATSAHATRSARLLVSLAAVLLVAASAGFGCYFAWHVGAHHDAVLGALSVAMAAGLELSKPFTINSAFTQLRQFRIFTATALTAVGLLAIAYSLQSELTFMSLTRGDLVAERAGEREAAQRAAERYEKLTTELAALKLAVQTLDLRPHQWHPLASGGLASRHTDG